MIKFIFIIYQILDSPYSHSKKILYLSPNRYFRIKLYIYKKLSENLIRKFHYKVDWVFLSSYTKLSEDFIQEFQDKVHWYGIGVNQTLSEKFILKYWNKLDHDYVILYQESLTPAFLCWLYRTYQEYEYNLLKSKNYEFREHAKKIEEEVKIIMIEFV